MNETIIRIRTACTKISCLCETQLADGLLLKMLKYFEGMFNIFEFSHLTEIVES